MLIDNENNNGNESHHERCVSYIDLIQISIENRYKAEKMIEEEVRLNSISM